MYNIIAYIKDTAWCLLLLIKLVFRVWKRTKISFDYRLHI